MTLKPMRHDPSTSPRLQAALEQYEAEQTSSAGLSYLRAKLVRELPRHTPQLSSAQDQSPSATVSHTIKVLLLAALYTGVGYYIAQPQQGGSNQVNNADKVDALTMPAPAGQKEDSKQLPQFKKDTAKPQALEPHTKINSKNNQKEEHRSSRHRAPSPTPGTLHHQILLYERIKAAVDQKRFPAAELESVIYLSNYHDGAFQKDITTLRQQFLSTPVSAAAIVNAPPPSQLLSQAQRKLFDSGVAQAQQTVQRAHTSKEHP